MPEELRANSKVTAGGLAVLLLLTATACEQPPRPERAILRLGVSNAPALATERGVKQFLQNMTSEGLLRVNSEGHLEPWLAEGWTTSSDGLNLVIRLRANVTFHDGSAADAEAIATILNTQLATSLKTVAVDVESISAKGTREIEVHLRRPSALFPDSLMDVQIVKTGTAGVATGAFKTADEQNANDAQVIAYDNYYLGKPQLGGLRVSTYPNVRAAWADMLRDQLDMLYEVGNEALATMQASTKVSLYAFERPYQYTIFLNTRNAKLKDPAIRQALNEAIDRDAFVRNAMGGNGTPSAGPVSPHHWAFDKTPQIFTYAPARAAAKLTKPLTLKCVTLADPPFEQLALIVKQQLREVGVNLEIEQAGIEQVFGILSSPDFETVLLDPSSGWSLMRPYRWWHSKGGSNQTKFSSPLVDAALESISHAANESEYRTAVSAFQAAVAEDPPAIFLAWSKRSRAVSSEFDVSPQPGRDVLASLRMWHPRTDNRNTTH